MRKPVLLIGMMGCGKSTVGRLLAERMRLPLIDLDEEIARAAEKTIPEIFAQEGEAGFRARETAALERALAREAGVIATGGGIVTRAENIRMTRPNLAGDKAERMRTLYGRRERLYAAAAHLSFDNRMPPEEAAKALQKLLTE